MKIEENTAKKISNDAQVSSLRLSLVLLNCIILSAFYGVKNGRKVYQFVYYLPRLNRNVCILKWYLFFF